MLDIMASLSDSGIGGTYGLGGLAMVSKKAQQEAKDSLAGQLAAKGFKPTEIARRLGKSTASVYRTLSVAEGETPAPQRGETTK